MAVQRSFAIVPRQIIWLIGGALLLQISVNFFLPPASAKAQALTSPPTMNSLLVASMGEPIGLAKFAGLR
jgi:hypothetical protein